MTIGPGKLSAPGRVSPWAPTCFINEFKNIRIGITVIDNVFICKMLSCDQYLLRKYYGIIWAKFRKLFGNYQATLPRLWYV